MIDCFNFCAGRQPNSMLAIPRSRQLRHGDPLRTEMDGKGSHSVVSDDAGQESPLPGVRPAPECETAELPAWLPAIS